MSQADIPTLLKQAGYFNKDVPHKAQTIRIAQWRQLNRRYPVSSMTQSPSGHVHRQLVEKVGPLEAPLTECPVIVRCSCQDFKFRWDYALYRDGISKGIASRRMPAPVRNPTNDIAVCKHLFKVLSAIYQVHSR